ncbi:MAG: tyrosine-protein kinase [Actinomycetota bacterium]|jgi:capsular exopolysaccharide synthesis family protein|nr:tyrosine-protein kinase [Actinomycetota bacterium]
MSTSEMALTARDDQTLALRDYVDILRKRKLQIFLVVALLLGALLAYGLTRTTLYQAQAKVLVEPIPNPVTAITSNPQAFIPNMDTEKELVTSDAAAQLVAQKLGLHTPPSELLKHVTGGFVINTSVLTVAYRDPNPATAARLADAFGEAYISLRTNSALRQIVAAAKSAKTQSATLQHQLHTLNAQIAAAPASKRPTLESQRTTLSDRLTATQQRAAQLDQSLSSQEGGRIVQHAKVPTSAASPNLKLFVVLGILGGLILGVAIAFLRESLGDHLRNGDEVERLTGAPLIAEVSAGKGRRRSPKLTTIRSPEDSTSEGYRTLGAYLQRFKDEGGAQAFMVTSPAPAEGKSEVAANLGVVLAEAANSVILVDANLRHPELAGYFGSTDGDGLASMLGDAKHPQTVIADWLERAEDRSSMLSSNGSRPGQLKIIGNGSSGPNPAAMLSNGRAGGIFDALRGKAQFLIVDAPQVLGVADTAILTRLVDGALLVVHGQKSTRREVEQAKRALDNAGTRLLGCVYVSRGR